MVRALDNRILTIFSFKNGSLTRERIRASVNCDSWQQFDKLLNETPPGNNGHIGEYLYYILNQVDVNFV